MILAALFFYLFAGVCVASAFMVIAAKNPVHSVLFLILTFVSASGLFVLLGAEFLAMILIVVYVGAVAVLFLFVVMMLDVDFAALRQGFAKYLPIGAVVAAIMVGMESRKENSSAAARERPAVWPAAMVAMEREVPGKTADSVWHSPIQIACPKFIRSISLAAACSEVAILRVP